MTEVVIPDSLKTVSVQQNGKMLRNIAWLNALPQCIDINILQVVCAVSIAIR
ncbi:hypothetical protein D3C76_1216910 [compost metagenome]